MVAFTNLIKENKIKKLKKFIKKRRNRIRYTHTVGNDVIKHSEHCPSFLKLAYIEAKYSGRVNEGINNLVIQK